EDTPGNRHLVAYIVPAAATAIDPDALRLNLQTKLPEYMVPSFIVVIKELPLTVNGKVDRQALPKPQDRAKVYSAPRNSQEEVLCRIFAEVLSRERVGIDDNFFSLG